MAALLIVCGIWKTLEQNGKDLSACEALTISHRLWFSTRPAIAKGTVTSTSPSTRRQALATWFVVSHLSASVRDLNFLGSDQDSKQEMFRRFLSASSPASKIKKLAGDVLVRGHVAFRLEMLSGEFTGK